MPSQCWVSGLFCDVPFNETDDDLRHRNVSVCTDIFEEVFCRCGDSELCGGGHIDIPVVKVVYLFSHLEIYRYICD